MYKYIKRIFDIIFSMILLIVCFIPMVIIAVAIKLESEGPIIFKQVRTGKGGEEFKVYKFRSMAKDNNVRNFKVEDKMTKVGKFIRKTSLDELPQLINILKGDMSFIGPRPWITDYYQNFTEEQKRRVEVLPGITGLAQAKGRNNITIFEKINYDLEYIDHYGFKEDIKVIFLTIKTVLSKEGIGVGKATIQSELEELKTQQLPAQEIRLQANIEKDSSHSIEDSNNENVRLRGFEKFNH